MSNVDRDIVIFDCLPEELTYPELHKEIFKLIKCCSYSQFSLDK